MALIGSGDEVIIPAPSLGELSEMVKLAEGINGYCSAGIEQDFKSLLLNEGSLITPRTKALILCSPSNPTGSVQ